MGSCCLEPFCGSLELLAKQPSKLETVNDLDRDLLERSLKAESAHLGYGKHDPALRKVAKARGHFPGDYAVVTLLWLDINSRNAL
ncbi:hypothetical protein GCM10022224_088080 [Nonomuraea antimicrobica]|uniref:Uncharacterized protein n=1 Tax=Nonomuraea antimicrobica TaxID=561173 RepID=A0ABP7DRP2_9ACTN